MFSSFTYDYSFYILFFFLLTHEVPNSIWEVSMKLGERHSLAGVGKAKRRPTCSWSHPERPEDKGTMGVRASTSKIMMLLQFSDEVMFVRVFLHMYLLEVYTWGFPNISKSNK